MIADEIKSDFSTVRIHDEFCCSPSQGCLSHLNQIVTNSYKRRSAAAEAAQLPIHQNENSMPQ